MPVHRIQRENAMLVEVKVPVLAESVAEASLLHWRKQVGDEVKFGEGLIDLETDKVTLEIVAPDNGVLVNILKSNGEDVESNEVIAQLDTEAETGLAADAAELATDDAELATDEAEPAADEAELAADEAEPAAGEAEPAADEAELAADEAEPAADEAVLAMEADTEGQGPQAEAEPESATPGTPAPQDQIEPEAVAPEAKLSPAVRHLLAEHGLDAAAIPSASDRLTKEDILSYLAEQRAQPPGEPAAPEEAKAAETDSPEAAEAPSPDAAETAPPAAAETAPPTAAETPPPTATEAAPPTAAETPPPTAAEAVPPAAAEAVPSEAAETAPPAAAEAAPPDAAEAVPPAATETAPPDAAETAPPDAAETAPPTAAETAPSDAAMPADAGKPETSRTENRVPMTRLRRRAAERLLSAQRENAILTTFNEVNMQPVKDLRDRHKESFEKIHGIKLGLMSFFTKAVIEGLRKLPVVNASVEGQDLVYHEYFDIGIAVSSPRGLVVPVIRDADALSFADIEKAIATFGQKAKEAKLTLDDLTGGTFTITNGGVFGSLLSTPILNPPQSAILGMHKIQERPVAENGAAVIRPMMYLALSYDHRIIDGREAVSFLVAVKESLEDPSRLLLQV